MDGLLATTLAVAVPIWQERLCGTTEEYRRGRREVCAKVVAAHGNVILYGSRSEGEATDVFNRLAEGLALLSFEPGGATFAGLVWTTTEARASREGLKF